MSDYPQHDERFPNDVMIFLDSPVDGAVVPRSPFVASGWAVDRAGPLVAILVGIDRQLWTGARLHGNRPDVAAAHPELPTAGQSGWRAELDLTQWPQEEVEVSVLAVRSDGTWRMEVPARVRLRPPVPGR